MCFETPHAQNRVACRTATRPPARKRVHMLKHRHKYVLRQTIFCMKSYLSPSWHVMAMMKMCVFYTVQLFPFCCQSHSAEFCSGIVKALNGKSASSKHSTVILNDTLNCTESPAMFLTLKPASSKHCLAIVQTLPVAVKYSDAHHSLPFCPARQ